MSLLADLSALLHASTPLAAAPIYHADEPQDVAPHKITLRQQDEKRLYSNDGDAGIVTRNVVISCCAVTQDAAGGLADAVTAVLGGYTGTAGASGGYPGTRIGCCLLWDRRDDCEPVDAGRSTPYQMSVLVVRISYYSGGAA